MLRAGARMTGTSVRVLDALGRLRMQAFRRGGTLATLTRAEGLTELSRAVCALHAVTIERVGALPEPPFVLVSNHLSYLDPLVLATLTPCVPIAKRAVASWPMIGPLASTLGVLFVDRGSVHSGARVLRAAAGALAGGVSVLNFPEGTTTRRGPMLPFRRGIFGLAIHAGVPVVPVRLRYDSEAIAWIDEELFLPHYLGVAARREIVARVDIGEPMPSCVYRRAEVMARHARAAIVALGEPR
jgi:1-acyl-sn-glycerol-3-phosphate acyltransferase